MDTDDILFGYMHVPTFGQESLWAAVASECAGEEGQFWAYHDLLYERFEGTNRGTYSKENLKALGAELGLNPASFNACVDDERTMDVVLRDGEIARELVIRGTPTFAVNGRSAVGSMPIENFRALVEGARQDNPYGANN